MQYGPLSRNVLNAGDILFQEASSPFPGSNVLFLFTYMGH